MMSDSNECFDDSQRFELLEDFFVPCTEMFRNDAVAGTLVAQHLSPLFLQLYLFIYINVQLKTIFPSFPLGFGQVIRVKVIYENFLKNSKVVPPAAVSFSIC